LRQLETVRRESGLPVLTDVHEPAQAAAAATVCDALQIPAFLCRQTDLIEAAARTGRPVNIKKGQWMAPEDMAGAVAKARAAGAPAVAVTERGTFFGYGDLVVDMRSFARLHEATGAPTVFDGTHSVQRPGRAGGASGGDPQFTPALVRAAVAAGAHGLFLEVHPAPERAPSDATNMLRLDPLRPLLEQALAIRSAFRERAPAAAYPAVAHSGRAGPSDPPRPFRCRWRADGWRPLHRALRERGCRGAEAVRHHGWTRRAHVGLERDPGRTRERARIRRDASAGGRAGRRMLRRRRR